MDQKQYKQRTLRQKEYRTDLFPLIEKENLTDNIQLSGPPDINSKYTINQVFNLHDPLDKITLSKMEIEKIFVPTTEKITQELLQKQPNLDPVIRHQNSWQNYKTKPIKSNITILGNKTLLRYFRKFNNTSINENTNTLEYQTPELRVPWLPLCMILLAFHISQYLNTKELAGSEKTYSSFYFPNVPIWIKVLCNDCITCK